MAVTPGTSVSAEGIAGSVTISSLPGSTNDLLILHATTSALNAAPVAPAGWKQIDRKNLGGTMGISVFYKIKLLSDTSVTVTGSADIVATCTSYSGHNPENPIRANSYGYNGSGTSVTGLKATSPVAGLHVMCYGVDPASAETWNTPAGYTEQYEYDQPANGFVAHAGSHLAVSAGVITPPAVSVGSANANALGLIHFVIAQVQITAVVTRVASSIQAADATSLSSSIEVPYPWGVSVGDLLVLAVSLGDGSSPGTPSGWFNRGVLASGGTVHSTAVYTRLATSSDTTATSMTVAGFGSTQRVGRMLCIKGNDPTAEPVLAVTTFLNPGVPSTSIVLPGFNIPRPKTLLLAIASSDGNADTASYTMPGGMTQVAESYEDNTFLRQAVGAELVSTVQTIGSRTVTASESQEHVGFLLAIMPSQVGPDLTITSPLAGLVSDQITLAATASDTDGVASVQWQVDGSNYGSADTSSPYSMALNTGEFSSGFSHEIAAVATDSLGNTTRAVVSVTPDNPGVTWVVDGVWHSRDTSVAYTGSLDTTGLSEGSHTITAIMHDIYGVMSSDTVTIAVNNDTSGPTLVITNPIASQVVSGVVNLTATAVDPQGVNFVTFEIDGVAVGTDHSSPYSQSWDSTAVANGTHTIRATSDDLDSPVNTTIVSLTFTVNNDFTPPVVTIIAPPDGSEVSGIITIRVTATDESGIDYVQIQVDGINVGDPITLPVGGEYTMDLNTGLYSRGTHTITAIALDAS